MALGQTRNRQLEETQLVMTVGRMDNQKNGHFEEQTIGRMYIWNMVQLDLKTIGRQERKQDNWKLEHLEHHTIGRNDRYCYWMNTKIID